MTLLERYNITTLELPKDLTPLDITESFLAPNLRVTSTYSEDVFINIGANNPKKQLNFGTFYLTGNEYRKLKRFYETVQQTKTFWFRDPFDYNFFADPQVSIYGTYTQGIIILSPGTFSTYLGHVYKVYSLPTGRGYKSFLRRIYYTNFGISYYTGEEISPTNIAYNSDPTNEESYESYIDGTLPSLTNNISLLGGIQPLPCLAVKGTFLTPFRFISSFQATPVNTKVRERLYQISDLRLEEVILPLHRNTVSGFLPFADEDYISGVPSSQGLFSPTATIKQEGSISPTPVNLVFNYNN